MQHSTESMILNRTLRAIAIVALMLSFLFLLAEGKGGDDKSPAPRRTTRNTQADLQEMADEQLAIGLQNEEDKKQGENHSSGGPSDAALARILQNEEDKKSPAKSEAKSDQKKPSKPIILKIKSSNECAVTV